MLSNLRKYPVFVYGTLREGDNSGQNLRLGDVQLLGKGRARGRMFHLGEYPGAAPAETENDWIQGEVYDLADFPTQIAALDRYEGCDASSPEPHEYYRATTPVFLTTGTEIESWIYWLREIPFTATQIASGDWLYP